MHHLPAEPFAAVDPVRSDLARATVRVRARRAARVAGSLALLGGALLLCADALEVVDVDALVALAGAWLGAGVTGLLAYGVVRATARPDPTLLRALGPGTASEKLSLVAPAVAVSLVAPLSLHGVVSLLLGCGPSATTFDDWVRLSLILVGHAHVALALRASFDAIAASEDRGSLRPLPAVGLATLVASVPGVLAYAVPPVLVFITGAAFVPALYGAIRRWRDDDRALLYSTCSASAAI